MIKNFQATNSCNKQNFLSNTQLAALQFWSHHTIVFHVKIWFHHGLVRIYTGLELLLAKNPTGCHPRLLASPQKSITSWRTRGSQIDSFSQNVRSRIAQHQYPSLFHENVGNILRNPITKSCSYLYTRLAAKPGCSKLSRAGRKLKPTNAGQNFQPD